MRFTLELSADLSKEDIEKEVMAFDKTKQYMEGKNPQAYYHSSEENR